MAIDPTAPVTPILPAPVTGRQADSVATLQAMARQALANSTAQLGEIVGRPPAAPTKSGEPVEQAGQDAGHAADTTDARGAAPGLQHPPAAKSETLLIRAVRAATAEAVPRQAGLAPLMANVRAVVERPDMPDEVRAAGRALLANTPSAAEITTPKGLRQAVQRSGVFLEARMARAAVLQTPDGTSAVPEAGDMKAALLVFRSALSAWLAKAPPQRINDSFDAEPDANPATIEDAEAPSPTSPRAAPSVSSPTSATTSQRPPVAASFTPSAPLPEATPKAAATPSAPRGHELFEPAPEGFPAAPGSQEPLASDEGLSARFGPFVAAPKASAPPQAPARAAMSPLVQLGLIAEEALAEDPAAAPVSEPRAVAPRGYGPAPLHTAGSRVPPPPYAGGPMDGQRPAAPDLPVDQSPADLVRRLLKGAGGALARQDLMQIASLPEPHEPEAGETRPQQQGARLNLDLPFATPQGVAVAQFEFSHDGGGAGGGYAGAAERTYKARFSIDLEPLGPVHALVTLAGSRTRVSLWAERAETIARLRADEESLGAALRRAELSPEVAVHSGAPTSPGAASPLGHFVDQAS